MHIRGPRPWVDVQTHGASPSASATTNNAAFTAAIAAAGTAGEVVIPGGTYNISTAIGLGALTHLRGVGRELTIINLASSSNTDVISGNGSTGGSIRDLKITGNSAGQTSGHGIHLVNTVDFDIQDVDVTDCKNNGVYIENGGGRIRIFGGWIHANKGHGIIIQATPIVDTVLIEHAWISDNGIATQDFQNVRAEETPGVRLFGNVIWQASGDNVLFYASPYSSLVGNYILSAGRCNVRLGGHAGAHPSEVVIMGNTFLSASIDGASLYPHIELGGHTLGYVVDANSQVDRVNVLGNVFAQAAGPAPSAVLTEQSGSTDTLVAFNTIQDSVKTITLAGTGSRMFGNAGYVTQNSGTGTIASGATTAVVTHGLSVTPTLDDISIVFGEQGTADWGRWWVSTITSTQFTLNVSVDPGASNLDFGWRAVAL